MGGKQVDEEDQENGNNIGAGVLGFESHRRLGRRDSEAEKRFRAPELVFAGRDGEAWGNVWKIRDGETDAPGSEAPGGEESVAPSDEEALGSPRMFDFDYTEAPDEEEAPGSPRMFDMDSTEAPDEEQALGSPRMFDMDSTEAPDEEEALGSLRMFDMDYTGAPDEEEDVGSPRMFDLDYTLAPDE
jgi:hypothetical protein